MPARRPCWPTLCDSSASPSPRCATARSTTCSPASAPGRRISASPAIPTSSRSAPRNWQSDPFAGEVRNGVLYGRGACDMKGGIAAFVAAAAQHLADGPPRGSISLLITGDEEGPAVDGTVRVLEWMQANRQIPDFCIVGEPTCPVTLGDMVKIGRRGSLNAKITVHGTQGHVAYPQRADNPVHRLIRVAACADRRTARRRQRLVPAVQPAVHQHRRRQSGDQRHPRVGASAMLNIRFNSDHTGAALSAWLRAVIAQHAERFDLDIAISGEVFLTEPGPLVDTLRQAIIDASRRGAEARHRRRHLGCALHRALLPGGGVRPGRRHHAPGGRTRAGGRTARPRAHLPRHPGGVSAHERSGTRTRRTGLAASWSASCVWRADAPTACASSARRARRSSRAWRRWSRFRWWAAR